MAKKPKKATKSTKSARKRDAVIEEIDVTDGVIATITGVGFLVGTVLVYALGYRTGFRGGLDAARYLGGGRV